MCLSDVYISSRNEGNLLLRNIADIKIKGDVLVMTDIMGIPRQLKATVKEVDLIDNYIVVDMERDPA